MDELQRLLNSQTLRKVEDREDNKARGRLSHLYASVRRAFSEFLTIPTLVIAAFLALSVAVIWLDSMRIKNGWPSILPGSHESVQTLLGTIASAIITVTSITFSLLLVAVQQGAAALTSQVYDQFLRRRANQVFFGFFVGLALYCLVILAAVHPDYTPVYGAMMAFALTVVALFLLIILIYSTIDQMRPVMIVKSILQHTRRARSDQGKMLEHTWEHFPESAIVLPRARVPSKDSGYVTRIDVEMLARQARKEGAEAVGILPSIGDYVSRGEDVLELRRAQGGFTDRAADKLLAAIRLDDQRDLDTDPAYGIEQLVTVGWTSTSTAKSNPQPGILACLSLQDLVGEWFALDAKRQSRSVVGFPVIYTDNVFRRLLDGLESLTVVASESMQHQTLAAAYRALAFTASQGPRELGSRAADITLRSLTALGDHVFTQVLEDACYSLVDMLRHQGFPDAADKLESASRQLSSGSGELHSRATRSP